MAQRALGNNAGAAEKFKRLSGYSEEVYKPVYALFLMDEGKRDQAVQEFERVWKGDPENRAFRTMLVSAYRETGRNADAEKILSAVLAKNKKDVDALLQRSDIYFYSGRYAQAQADLSEVIHFRPDSAEAHYILAKIDAKRSADLSERQELTDASG